MATQPTRDYDDIPGTYIFDGRRSRQGYALNMLCMSLNTADGRAAFQTSPDGCMAAYGLSPEQAEAMRERDWLRLLQLGGNIYYTFKLAAMDGLSMQDVGASMSGVTTEQFSQMMLDGGRSIEGNRSLSEEDSSG